MVKKSELYFILLLEILSIISYGFVYCGAGAYFRSLTTTLLVVNAVWTIKLIVKKREENASK
jgi:protein-S-isoprenylcysteine O-methyltransferase Ste14